MNQKIFTEFVGRREETEQSKGAGVLRFVPGRTVFRRSLFFVGRAANL
jgi:hypothetical protein